ncbi:MAG: hypothetical protein M5U28_55665 [Sandaracinaceae bacterium]|nr:hypothetical protein [Sandaracinaceae bacterium]
MAALAAKTSDSVTRPTLTPASLFFLLMTPSALAARSSSPPPQAA